MKLIKLTSGDTTKVDDEDFDLLSKNNWYLSEKGYAFRRQYVGYSNGKTKQKKIYLHRFVLNLSDPNLHVDHKNGDKLDNRRKNLRLCTIKENACNRGKQANNTSGYKGVHQRKDNGKYVANIRVNQKLIYLGQYLDPKSAYNAYKKAAKMYQGEYYHG